MKDTVANMTDLQKLKKQVERKKLITLLPPEKQLLNKIMNGVHDITQDDY